MKTLTKLALISAMAMSSSAFAMQALDDSDLSATTGQEGVTIELSGNIAFDYMAIVDEDGLTPAGSGIVTPSRGAIVVGDGLNPVTITAANGINVVVDADGNGTSPVLNVNLDLGDTVIAVGSIGVANTDATGKTITNQKDILNVGNVSLDGLKVNIQLGNQAQGEMIRLNSTVAGGLELSNLALVGANGSIGLGTVNVSSTGNANGDLVLNLGIDPTAAGLEITGLTNIDVAASALTLGATPALGAMYISNLSVGNIAISGH